EFAVYLGHKADMEQIGKPSIVACPTCNGTLWEYDEYGVLQFRCRVGHSFTVDSLIAEHDGALEVSLWAATRALEENASLRRRVAEQMRAHKNPRTAERIDARAVESERHAAVLRALLTHEGEFDPTERESEG